MIDAGIFFLLTAIGVAFLFLTVRFKEYLMVIPVVIFLILGLTLFENPDIGYYTTWSDGVTTWNSTSYILGNGTGDYNTFSPWLAVAFILTSIILSFVVLLNLTDTNKNGS